MTQVLLGFGSGVLLGLRWKFQILYPAVVLVGGVMIGVGGLSLENAGLTVLVIAAIQAGYICGAFARQLTGRIPSVNRWPLGLHRH
jgi:hypothetical protein